MIPINTDLTLGALNILPNQFYEKVNYNAFLSAHTDQLQISNDTLFNTIQALNVNDATGYLLDCIGSYVAVLRNGDIDDAYRERIRRRILTASSEGTPNDLIGLLEIVTEGDVSIFEHFPVATYLSTTGTRIPNNLTISLQNASPASSGDVVVLLNPFENCFVPSELGFDVFKLASRERNLFVTNNLDFVTVNQLNFEGGETQFAKLSEFTYGIDNGTESHIQDGLGILCEISYINGGVFNYNNDYVELGNAVDNWYLTMNVTVPTEFN